MFDSAKVLKLTGVVQTFSWSNPHTYIEIQAPDASGAVQKWGVECTSPAVLVRAGWKSTTLKPGDQVTISVHPLRSGELGGSFVAMAIAGPSVRRPSRVQFACNTRWRTGPTRARWPGGR